MAIELTQDEQDRLEHARQADPQAYDLLLKGLEMFRRFTAETNAEARSLFKQALELDPDFARAHADVALTHALDIQFGWSVANAELFENAFGHAQRALELDDKLVQALFSLSLLHMNKKEHDRALQVSQRMVSLHPSYADGYAQFAQMLVYAGEPEEALDKLQTAMELNPRHSFFYTWIEGHAHMMLGNTKRAEELFLNVIERNAFFPGAHLTLTALYGNENRLDDAEWQAVEILNLRPQFSRHTEAQRIP